MRIKRVIPAILVILLGAAACRSSSAPSASLTQAMLVTVSSTKQSTSFFMKSPTRTISPTIRSEPSPSLVNTRSLVPGLHSAGPYLLMHSVSAGLFELDGSGWRFVTLPDIAFGKFSPDGKWFASTFGELDGNEVEPKAGVVLRLWNLFDGTAKDVATLLPEDYLDRQAKMIDDLEKRYPSGYPYNQKRYTFSTESAVDILGWGINRLSWSPDGRFLAFAAMLEGNSTDIYTYDIDTGTVRRLYDEELNVVNPEWSPDGSRIAYRIMLPLKEDFPLESMRIASQNQQSAITLADFTSLTILIAEWVSGSYLLLSDFHDYLPLNLFLVDTRTGSRYEIWDREWRSLWIDKSNMQIILSADYEDDESHYFGDIDIYGGSIFGKINRISDGINGKLKYRAGSIHPFIVEGEDAVFGIRSDWTIDELGRGEYPKASISPDWNWMAIYGNNGITVFNEVDEIIWSSDAAPVYNVAWKTNSQGLFFMTPDSVYFLPMDPLRLQPVFGCQKGLCEKYATLQLLPGINLPSLPKIRVRLPSVENPKEGTSLWSKAAFRDLQEPGAREYAVSLPAYSEWRWDFSWCAATQDGLAGILAPFDIQFFIGGEKIGEDAFRMYDSGKGGGFCRTWATLLSGWQPVDETDLEIRYALSEAVDDGTRTYPAGEYRQIIHITVTG